MKHLLPPWCAQCPIHAKRFKISKYSNNSWSIPFALDLPELTSTKKCSFPFFPMVFPWCFPCLVDFPWLFPARKSLHGHFAPSAAWSSDHSDHSDHRRGQPRRNAILVPGLKRWSSVSVEKGEIHGGQNWRMKGKLVDKWRIFHGGYIIIVYEIYSVVFFTGDILLDSSWGLMVTSGDWKEMYNRIDQQRYNNTSWG